MGGGRGCPDMAAMVRGGASSQGISYGDGERVKPRWERQHRGEKTQGDKGRMGDSIWASTSVNAKTLPGSQPTHRSAPGGERLAFPSGSRRSTARKRVGCGYSSEVVNNSSRPSQRGWPPMLDAASAISLLTQNGSGRGGGSGHPSGDSFDSISGNCRGGTLALVGAGCMQRSPTARDNRLVGMDEEHRHAVRFLGCMSSARTGRAGSRAVDLFKYCG